VNFSNSIEVLAGGGVVSPLGFAAGAARAGIKTEGDDIALIVSHTPAVAAAVFTRNAVKAAPVLVCAEHAAYSTARAIIANSGCANCCTGAQGLADARRMCELAAQKLYCDEREVLVCSTGLIGQKLPMENVEAAIDALALLAQDEADVFNPETVNEAIARAVMTTDTRPKFCAVRAVIGGRAVTVGGQAKGVGMIGPNMAPLTVGSRTGGQQSLHATMLAFLTTDAQIEKALLQEALETAVAVSFNSVTVDGDTSTNDTCLLLANGASGARISEAEYFDFCSLLEEVCVRLARMIAADGEARPSW
jgi:glutamate N-acetyltransferase/amino-acid N-acetyltransferase